MLQLLAVIIVVSLAVFVLEVGLLALAVIGAGCLTGMFVIWLRGL